MQLEDFPLPDVFHLLESGPVILVTTSDGEKPDVMAMSWHMMVDFDPPLISFVMSSGNLSQKNLRKTHECVIAVPGVDLMEKVVDIGNCSGRDVDKFSKFSVTRLPAGKVRAPLVGECLANVECRVVDDSLADKYEIFVLEGVKAWINRERKERRLFHARGDGRFFVDGKMRDLSERMVKFKDMI
jgi:flavin reductase (DIM6/NTAB) family NADH-FMN oxidoreductase RutF